MKTRTERFSLLAPAVLLFLFGALAVAQPGPTPQIRYVTADPTGAACQRTSIALRVTTGVIYTCVSGVYAASGGGGSGTVTSVASSCGVTGGTITTTGTLKQSQAVNAQTGTSYTIVDGDCGKLITNTNASATANTLPQANGSTFVAGWATDVFNGGAGTVTITPTTSTINGAATLVLTTGFSAHIVSDGTNYTAELFSGYDPTKNGCVYQIGATSGGLAICVANVAGTATTLIWPIDSGAATSATVLTLGAVATCPTLLPANAPTTCRFLTWTAPAGGATFTTPYLVTSGLYYFPGMYSAATLPSAATWTSTGGANTWTAAGDAFTLTTAAPGGNGANVSGRRDATTLANGDFTVTAFLDGCWNPAATAVQYSGCGVFLYDGTKFVTWGFSASTAVNPVLAYDYYTNATTASSQNLISGQFPYAAQGLIGLRITKTSGNLTFSLSLNGGMSWTAAASGISCTAHFASCASLNAGVHASPTWTSFGAATSLVSWLEQ